MKRISLIAIAAIVGLTAMAVAVAPLGDTMDLDWNTIDGGGATSSAGPLGLSGTIGQPDPGVLSGGTYSLTGGFHAVTSSGPPPCPTDLNGDGNTDPADLAGLLDAWGPNPGHPGDINGNGTVGPEDLAALLDSWGGCP